MRAGPISGCCDMTAGLTSSFAADEARRVAADEAGRVPADEAGRVSTDEAGRVSADEARRELILWLL